MIFLEYTKNQVGARRGSATGATAAYLWTKRPQVAGLVRKTGQKNQPTAHVVPFFQEGTKSALCWKISPLSMS